MSNTIAYNEKGELVHSSMIYKLRNKDKRIDARNEYYSCPHCKTEMVYAHSGQDGCFKHIPSTPQNVKDDCPYYSGLLSGCSKEVALAIERRKKEVQQFLEENKITGYKVISYYSEPKLVKYIEKYSDEDFIMVGNMITKWEYEQLIRGVLILRKKALAKYLSSNKKCIIQTFVGTKPDTICLTKYKSEFGNEVHLTPYLLSVDDLKNKTFSGRKTFMTKSEILESRITRGRHSNIVWNGYFK